MKDPNLKLLGAFAVLGLAATLLIVWFMAESKAAAYNRVTGEHVSAWDALILDLRVQAPPKKP